MRSTRVTAMALSTTLVAGVLVVGTTLMMPADAADTASPVQVTVNARAGLVTVSDAAIGVNHAVWDSATRHRRGGRPHEGGRRPG